MQAGTDIDRTHVRVALGMLAAILLAASIPAGAAAGPSGSEKGSREVAVPTIAGQYIAGETLAVECTDWEDPDSCTEHKTPDITTPELKGLVLRVSWLASGSSSGVTHDEIINPPLCTARGMRGAGIRVVSHGGVLHATTTVELDFADEGAEDRALSQSRTQSQGETNVVERIVCVPLTT